MNKKKLASLIMIFAILLSSCTLLPHMNETGKATLTPQSSLTTNFTQAQVPSPEITSTVSSLSKEEYIRDLYEHNGGCEFPCFWGIMPGRDSSQDVFDRLTHYGNFDNGLEDNQITGFISFSTSPPKDIDIYEQVQWTTTMEVQDGIVSIIFASSEYLSLFANPSLDIFLKEFGPPKEIWMMVFPGMGIQPWYEIALFYPEKGTLVSWRGTANPIVETDNKITVSICPQDFSNEIDMILYFPPKILFWAPAENLTFSNVNREYLNNQPYLMVSAENSDIAPNSFYNIYIDPETEKCFQYTLN